MSGALGLHGITVRNSTQTSETAVTCGAFQIENVYPLIDGGRFAVKRIAGEPVDIWGDVYRDGHNVISVVLKWKRDTGRDWQSVAMTHHENDRWTAQFTPTDIGGYHYFISAWTAEFATWQKGFKLKLEAGQDVTLDAMEGLDHLAHAKVEPSNDSAVIVKARDDFIRYGDPTILCTPELAEAMGRCEAQNDLTSSAEFPLTIDRERARYSTWYEMVPRSQSPVPGRHGTFRDCMTRLPDIAAMGFDVLYFTPIHPIGVKNRKGKNNALTSTHDDPGSPYAIGGQAGGHDALHPELGTMDDFQALRAACADHGMEIALDIAVQCSLDHPWLKQHPEWFKYRPDGTIKYAENPPKKYEDIVNPDMTGPHAQAIWDALRDILLYWVTHGVKSFPDRQSAHQTLPLLGMGNCRYPARPSGCHFFGRGLHASKGDEGPSQTRLHPILYLFHLAHRQIRDRSLSERIGRLSRAGVLSAKLLRLNAGHPALSLAGR